MRSIQANITRIDGERVGLFLADGQTLTVPKDALDGSPEVGSVVHLLVVRPGGERAGQGALARELLNEILRT